MKNNIVLALLFFLIPILINGQTQEAITSDGKKVILNADGTWKYTEEVTTSDGKKVILNADGTWKYAELIERRKEEAEKKRIEAEKQRESDIKKRTNDLIAHSQNRGTSSTGEGISEGPGNQGDPNGSVNSKVRGTGSGLGDKGTGTGSPGGKGGISYSLQGRGVQALPSPRYDYMKEGKVVVEVSVDRSGKVVAANPGIKGSTTLDEDLLKVAKEAAMKASFEAKQDAPALQKGTITYNFILK